MTLVANDKKEATQAVGLGQIVSASGSERLTSVVGSCVGLVLYHSPTKRGVMAHVLLPQYKSGTPTPGKYADLALNEILDIFQREGIAANELEAKIAGGAQLFGGPKDNDIGLENGEAILGLLKQNNISLAGQDLGGNKGRRLEFDCSRGTLKIAVLGQPGKVL